MCFEFRNTVEDPESAYGKATVGVIIQLGGRARRQFRSPEGDPHALDEQSDSVRRRSSRAVFY